MIVLISIQMAILNHAMATMKNKKKGARDTGLAIFLILLVWSFFAAEIRITIPAVLVLIAALTVPSLFAPLAPLWFWFSKASSMLSSQVILAFLFFFVLTPIALWRRLMGADPLSLKLWKCGNQSVFVHRHQKIEARHLEKPF
jgi:hypothetical protein